MNVIHETVTYTFSLTLCWANTFIQIDIPNYFQWFIVQLVELFSFSINIQVAFVITNNDNNNQCIMVLKCTRQCYMH